jgi:hypothetical protein
MSALLTATAASGTDTVTIQGARLLSWLIPGMGVSFELLEDAIIDTVTDLGEGVLQVVLTENLVGTHATATRFSIRSFSVAAPLGAVAGDGAVGSPFVSINTPFILVPGDVLTVDGATFTLSLANQVAVIPTGFSYEVKVEGTDGFPVLTSSTAITVRARAAYQSDILTVPQAVIRSLTVGPVAVDWVSGPMVADYFPDPESTCYIEEFDSTSTQIVAPRIINKNDTLLRFQIMRDQMLFWRSVEGSVDWNGTFMELKAHASGRAHLWTPCRPCLDVAPPITKAAVVPSFAPYRVLLLSRIFPDSVVVINSTTKAVIPDTDYTVDNTAGHIDFAATHASQPVIVTYRPRLEWQIRAEADVDDVEVVVKVGSEDKQVFTLPTAGIASTLTVQVSTDVEIDQLHITARRADDSPGPITVQLGDWQPRGGITSAIRYTLTTGAEIDYDWSSSGLLFKPLWPTIELLRARLDGESIFARFLDNGRMLV